MKRYMPYYRECEKICIDFSTEKVPGNTESLLNHAIPSELAQNFELCKGEIVKGRCLVTPPARYCTSSSTKSATAYYKLMLSRKLRSALEKLSVDDESWITIPGLSKKALKRKHFDPRNRASMFLAE